MDIKPYVQKLLSYIESNNYAGYDPYDALNSPSLHVLSKTSKWVRIAFIQFLKKFPFNLRPLLGVRKGYNPKGIGLFLWGYSKLYKVEKKPAYLEKIDYLLLLLESLKCKGYSGNCWGYNFDWQSRAFFVPKFTPTVVNSSFIGHALIDAYEYTGIQSALDMAISIKDFILVDLNRHEEDDTQCFSYTPIDSIKVHNANLLGASLLIRLYRITGIQELKDNALASLRYSLKYQREDGSWYYSETKGQQWIDSFHTGFVLESIRHFLNLGEALWWQKNYERGVNYYAKNFFLEDGTPKYYDGRINPVDIHSSAEAIYFFSGEGEEYRDLTDKILTWMMSNMWDESGYFYFRKLQYFTNKISYMRWSQAWGIRALTEYCFNNSNI